MAEKGSATPNSFSARHMRRVILKEVNNHCLGVEGIVNEDIEHINDDSPLYVESVSLPNSPSSLSLSKSSTNSESDDFHEIDSEDDSNFEAISNALEESSGENCPETLFEDQLASWAVDCNINQNAVTKLLKLLKTQPGMHGLPSDARTLLKTPKSTTIVDCGSGQYSHFGIKKGLNLLSSAGLPETIELLISADGLPLFKDSTNHFWPILGAISPNVANSEPFVIGIFHGKKKPVSADQFLRMYVEEMKTLLEEGLDIEGKHFNVVVKGYVCDAPARAFVKCIKGHTGYSGCGKCWQVGEYQDHRVCFPELGSSLRTDAEFTARSDDDHHHIVASPLEEIGTGMVSQFPYEYMHLVCLGVMKKLTAIWVKGQRPTKRLPGGVQDECSAHIESLKPYIGEEFNRKGRSLSEIDRWKATEWRLLLMYTGPVVLRGVITPRQYSHFLALHCAIRILASPKFHVMLNAYADSLLNHFVKVYGVLYGHSLISYNVHGLLHLASDVKKFGPLDSFSAFQFENALGKLKRLVRKCDKPLQQLSNRLAERNVRKTVVSPAPAEQTTFPNLCSLNGPLKLKGFSITKFQQDNCCLLNDGSVVIVEGFLRKGLAAHITGRKFKNLGPLYPNNDPAESTLMNIYVAHDLSEKCEWPASAIACKALRLPFVGNREFAILPIVHSLN